MGLWHNIKVRLGFEDEWDDEYYDDDEGVEEESYESDDGWRAPGYESPYGSGSSSVRPVDRRPSLDRGLVSVPTGGASVTPVSTQVKMQIVEPKSMTEAQTIADKFKAGSPVIMNLEMTKPDLARRMVDFASGLTYGLDGGLQKVSDKVFMLTPHNVEVSDVDRRRFQAKSSVYTGE